MAKVALHSNGALLVVLALAFGWTAAQTVTPTVSTPAGYYRSLADARDFISQRQFDKAADLYEKLVAYYADDAQTWERLGDCRRNLKQYIEAARAYEKAHDLGIWEPASSSYRIARSYALGGDKS